MTAAAVQAAAVILAAGEASRYGSPKQLLAIDGMPMVRRIAGNALSAGLQPVMVVVGSGAERVVDCLDQLDVHVVHNLHWASGMGGSIAAGARALMMQADQLQSVMVMLADQPAIRVVDLERMLARHAQSPEPASTRLASVRHAFFRGAMRASLPRWIPPTVRTYCWQSTLRWSMASICRSRFATSIHRPITPRGRRIVA